MPDRRKIVCRTCGRTAQQIGGYLKRVNEPGDDGIWECRPACDVVLANESRLLMAIDGENDGGNDA